MKRELLWQIPLLALSFGLGWSARGGGESDASEAATEASENRVRAVSANARFQNGAREERAREFLDSTDLTKNELWLRALVSEWAREDLVGALAFASEHDREDLVRIALQETRLDSLAAAQDWLAAQTGRDVAHDGLLMMQGLAANDPEGALTQVEKILKPDAREQGLALVFQEWARQDTSSFFLWISKQEVTPELELGYRKAMTAVIERDPARNAYVVAQLDESALKNELSHLLAREWARTKPEHAQQWVSERLAAVDAEEKQALLSGLVDGWAESGQGEGALDFLEGYRGEDGYDDLFRSAVTTLAYRDVETVRTRFETMTPEEQQAGARPLAEALVRQQSPEMNRWLQELTRGPVKDDALAIIAPSFQKNDPTRAVALAGQIENPGERLRIFNELMTAVTATSPEQAQNLIEQASGLSELERASLIENIEKAGSKNATDLLLPEN